MTKREFIKFIQQYYYYLKTNVNSVISSKYVNKDYILLFNF